MTRIVVVTGMSGAGKTSAIRMLEDLGHDTVDNLPIRLLPGLLPAVGEEAEQRPLAVGIDARTTGFSADAIIMWFETLRRRPDVNAELLFLDCADDVLARRFTETRRRHPLAKDLPVADGIQRERQLLAPLRDFADPLIDSSDYSLTDLREMVRQRYGERGQGELLVSLQSFSFKRGLPREADMVLDVRFLDNPYWKPDLRPLSGMDGPVQQHIAADPAFEPFFSRIDDLLGDLLPRYGAEGKSYFTIAIGCTGGRHRSVFTAERLNIALSKRGHHVVLWHREIGE